MKSFFSLFLLVPIFIFGFTNLKINNSTAPVVNVNDPLMISGSFEGGDTSATIKFYYDANQNFTLDSGDKLILFSGVYDGSPFDNDETQDGQYAGYITSIPTALYCFVTSQDAGGADTITLIVQPLSTSSTISGIVTRDGNPAEKVLAMVSINDCDFGSFTGTDGSYTINIPDSLVGDTAQISIIDFINNNPGYLGTVDSLVFSGNDTVNCQMTHTDATTLSGYIIDNAGDTLRDTFDLFSAGGYYDGSNMQYVTAQTFSNNGQYNMQITKGLYFSIWVFPYEILTSELYPLYTERADTSLTVSGNQSFNIYLYKNNSDIRGHIYIDSIGVDNFSIKCRSISDTIIGKMRTISYSDGRYILPVSTASDSYEVYINVPDGDSCGISSINAACGDTGIDFYIYQTGIKSKPLQKIDDINVKFSNGKLYLSSNTTINSNVSIYNIEGRKLLNKNIKLNSIRQSFNLKLENGIYFVVIKNSKRIVRKKFLIIK